MNVTVKKLWHGSVSIRDYLVQKCIDNKEDLEIQYNGEVMKIPYEQLNLGRKNQMSVKSNFKDEVYDLIDYFWIPDRKITEIEIPKLF